MPRFTGFTEKSLFFFFNLKILNMGEVEAVDAILKKLDVDDFLKKLDSIDCSMRVLERSDF